MDLNPDLLGYQTASEKTIISLHRQISIARIAMNDILGQDIPLETRYRIAQALEEMNNIEIG